MAELTLDDIKTLKGDTREFNAVIISSVALLVYDYLLTFADERRLVWPSRLSLMKVIFFCNRYLPFVASIGMMYTSVLADMAVSQHLCRTQFRLFGTLIWIIITISELILFIRAYAIWGRRPFIKAFLFTSFLGLVSAASYFACTFVLSASTLPIPATIIANGCTFTVGKEVDWIGFVFVILGETIALGVILARSVTVIQSRALKSIIADGVLYYVGSLIFSVLNIIVLKLAPSSISNILIVMQSILQSIFCTRLLLNIRGLYDKLSESSMLTSTIEPAVHGMPSGTETGAYPLQVIEVRVNREHGFQTDSSSDL